MPTAISGGSRIRTNIPAENAYNALLTANTDIANRQLRLSTGKRINSAADDVSGYITSRSLSARNGALKAALNSTGDATNVTAITQDALDNINTLLTQIKDAAATASSGALGTDEKVALAKGAYRLAQQIQFVTDSTVFGGKQLLQGGFSGDWTIGYYANNNLLTIGIDLTTGNTDFNVGSNNFNLNATATALAAAGGATGNFAGVLGLSLESLNAVSTGNLGVFASGTIVNTISSIADALNNVNKVASYLGGIQVRLGSQQELLKSQITNYNAAISRIEDADVATEQLSLVKSQFLQQSSLVSLAQANQAPQNFLQLFR
ncbi:MAG: flagellin [Candidatus Kapabacteria bacterium]|nr:flagellin [Candidatus Kapabacteria bacterium]